MGKLTGLTPIKTAIPCKIGQILNDLDNDDKKIFEEALTDERWTARALAKALTARGIPIATDTVRAHINKVCRCSRT